MFARSAAPHGAGVAISNAAVEARTSADR
jgi:hypothetical protein